MAAELYLIGGCMLKKCFYLILFLCFACAFGAPVSFETAKKAAGNYLRRNGQSADLISVKQKRADSPFFVFSKGRGKGYVIVSADDIAAPIFSDADEGDFDEDNMNPVQAYLMQNYGNFINDAVRNKAAQDSETKALWEKYLSSSNQTRGEIRAKTYLLATPKTAAGDIQWAQWEHGNQTPKAPNGEYSNVGCVATSMAQVIRYYCYPAKGKGILPSYKPTGWSTNVPAKDHSQVTYTYTNMPGCLKNGTSAQQSEAGKLMANCGHAAYMNYGAGESSTNNYSAASGMKDYFDYDPVIQPVTKNPITSQAKAYPLSNEDWNDLVIGNIENKAPVIYAGSGHSFIIDGYDSDNKQFHINLGYAQSSCNSGGTQYWYASAVVSGYEGSAEMVMNIIPNTGNKFPVALKVTEFTPTSNPVKITAKVVFGLNFSGKIGIATVSGNNINVIAETDFNISNEIIQPYRGGYGHTNRKSSVTLSKGSYTGSDLKVVAKHPNVNGGNWIVVGATATTTPTPTPTTNFTVTFSTDGGNAINPVTVAGGTAYNAPNPTKSGFVFAGWFKNIGLTDAWANGTVVNNNITLYAKWTEQSNIPATVNITLNSRQGNINSSTPNISTATGYTPATPTRDKCSFDGWHTDSTNWTGKWTNGTNPTSNMTLFAKWNATITFDTDGGSSITAVTVTTERTYTPPTTTKAGYSLEGWYTDAAKTNKWVSGTSLVTGNMTLYAKWTAQSNIPATVNITLNSRQGNVNSTTPNIFTNTGYTPATPTRANCTFDGWYEDSTNWAGKWVDGTKPTKNMTLFAKWNATITFNTDGGSSIAQVTVTTERTYTPPATTKSGSSLDGWFSDAAKTSRWETTSLVTGNMTLYAKWSAAVLLPAVNITLDARNGSAASMSSVLTNAGYTPTTPTRTGCTFDGWYSDKQNWTGKWVNGTIPTTHMTLFAKWNATITFNTDGGSSIAAVTVTTEESYSPPNPTKSGFVFAGWFANADFSIPWSLENKVEGNMTLFAKWNEPVKTWTITFNTDGGSTIANKTVTSNIPYYNASNDRPTKAGFDFIGWFADAAKTVRWTSTTKITDNITLYAKWEEGAAEKTTYKVRIMYYLDYGNDNHSDWMEFATLQAAVTDVNPYWYPRIDGHTFTTAWYNNGSAWNEWKENVSELVGDTTLYIYELKKAEFTITFYTDGGSSVEPVKVASKVYPNAAIFIPTQTPEREGFDFAGWYADMERTEIWTASSEVVSDTTLYAVWNEIRNNGGDNGGEGAIKGGKGFDGRHGITVVKNPVVSDFAEFVVRTPENWTNAKLTIYDNLGNVVFFDQQRLTISNDRMKWNLRNTNGRTVAAGTYLAVVECQGAVGVYQYYTKFGVRK